VFDCVGGILAVGCLTMGVVSTASAFLVAPTATFDFWAAPALPPIGHSQFCLSYPNDCAVRRNDFRRRNIVLTSERWNELNRINRQINEAIIPKPTDLWLIAPPTGDCKAYALTKRHELLRQGWPSRSLLLSEVALLSGEHHLILVVRVKGADLILDNLNDEIRLATMTAGEYQWLKIQELQNPRFWSTVRVRT